jgi:iron complex transport system ATP-binding protein
MLLDEPGTHLDLRHQVDLGNLLRSFARNRNLGVLMASHELNLAGQLADRLILLSQGAVVADGPPEQVLKPELLSSVYELPMRQISQDGQVYVMPVIDHVTTDSRPSA